MWVQVCAKLSACHRVQAGSSGIKIEVAMLSLSNHKPWSML